MSVTKNLGLVKAIFAQTTAPTNTQVIWLDTSLATPLHKAYNPTSLSWEAFIYLTLIDNNTIKRDGISGELYVDNAALAAYVLADGSVALVKLANVASGTIFYRKSAGAGVPELQTLAILKTDLGLVGDNHGDQDLSGLVQKSTTINSQPLTGNIILTPAMIGSPAGNGTSTGANSGDETEGTILIKLGLVSIAGINNGDQIASTVPITDTGGLFIAENVEAALAETKALVNAQETKLEGFGGVFSVSLSAGSNVNAKITGAVVPLGWTLQVGSTAYDIQINHGRNARVSFVFVWYIDGTEEIMLLNTAAYNGVRTPDANTLIINSLATGITSLPVKIYISFV